MPLTTIRYCSANTAVHPRPAPTCSPKPKTRREQYVDQCMPLVKRLAAKVHRQVKGNVARDELVAFGLTGLLESIDRYVPGGKASLATFAYYRIYGAMLDGIGEIAPMSRRCYRNARTHGDPHAIYRDSLPCHEIVDPNAKDNETQTAELELYTLLKDAISNLSETQQHLVRQHYFEHRTLLDAGADLGISKSWASRAHASALSALRAQLSDDFNT